MNSEKLIKDNEQCENPSSYSPSKPKIIEEAEAEKAHANAYDEIVIERYDVDGATVEIIKKPATIFAGRIGYADKPGIEPHIDFIWAQMYHYDENNPEWQNPADRIIQSKIPPEWDVCISLNYWKSVEHIWGMMFAREVSDENQPDGVDIMKVPEGLYIRVLCDEAAGKLIGKDSSPSAYEMFGYIGKFAVEHGYMLPDDRQEYEYRSKDRDENGHLICQYSYIPVVKI